MKGKDIYKIWAKENSKWANWIRPVPFVGINENMKIYEISDFVIPKIKYITEFEKNTAIIIDLPGNDSIGEGLAIAKLGYIPIPIYNGTDEQPGAIATVDNNNIKLGLIKGSLELEKIKIENNALPVFLLDSNRVNRYKMDVSIFDNSWDIYPQDMPTAEYLLKNDISKIIVRAEKIQRDLSKILYKFQKRVIKVLFTDGYEEPKIIKIKKVKDKEI